jgi:hypothetical protein
MTQDEKLIILGRLALRVHQRRDLSDFSVADEGALAAAEDNLFDACELFLRTDAETPWPAGTRSRALGNRRTGTDRRRHGDRHDATQRPGPVMADQTEDPLWRELERIDGMWGDRVSHDRGADEKGDA